MKNEAEVRDIEARIKVITSRETVLHKKIVKQLDVNDIDRMQPLINLANVYQEGIKDLMQVRSGYWQTIKNIGFKNE